jgi:hypothetical protein
MNANGHRSSVLPLTWAVLTLMATTVTAQELTPRAYWPAPAGTRVAVLGFNHSTGDVVTDPSLPVIGVDSDINLGLFAYIHYLSLWGRTSNILVEVPYSWGTTQGDLENEATRRDFSGIADVSVTLSVNLIGAPALTPEDFQKLRQDPHPILGASLKIVAPTGDYDPDKLINVGTNRWALKAELGYMIPIEPRWLLEFELGGWLIGDNDDFLGQTREQRPIVTGEFHLVRRFKPGFWASFDVNYYTGGRSTIGGIEVADLQRNSRIGGTIVVPVRRRHAFKLGYSTGVVTESGGDFEMLLLSFTTLFH